MGMVPVLGRPGSHPLPKLLPLDLTRLGEVTNAKDGILEGVHSKVCAVARLQTLSSNTEEGDAVILV
jgi:hypothetical protein